MDDKGTDETVSDISLPPAKLRASGLCAGRNRGRAAVKALFVGGFIGVTIAVLLIFARARVVNGLINHLTLGLLVVMVIVINIVSLGLGLIAFFAYKWIKRDLKGPDEDDGAQPESKSRA